MRKVIILLLLTHKPGWWVIFHCIDQLISSACSCKRKNLVCRTTFFNIYFPCLAVGSDEGDALNPKASDDAKALMMCKSVLAKYWILLCCGAFLLVGLQNEVSVYQIGYMAIFLFILICYQVNCVFHNDTKDMEQFSNDCRE